MTPSRRRRRRIAHVLAECVGTVVLVAVVHAGLPADLRSRQWLSVGLAYASLAALLGALTIGPLNALRRRPNPLSIDLRRDLGLWSAVTAVAHVVLSLGNHFDGRVARYFFDGGAVAPGALRLDRFGVGAWLGVAATVLVVMLAATSSDRAVRRLGTRWKLLQRWSVGLAVVVVVHTVLFWSLTDRSASIWGLAAVAVAGVAVLRTARSLRRPPVRA